MDQFTELFTTPQAEFGYCPDYGGAVLSYAPSRQKNYNDARVEVSVRQVVVSTQGLIVDERAWSDGTCSEE